MVNKYFEACLTSYLAGHPDLLKDSSDPAKFARVVAWGLRFHAAMVEAGGLTPVASQSSTSQLLTALTFQGEKFPETYSSPEEKGLSFNRGEIMYNL